MIKFTGKAIGPVKVVKWFCMDEVKVEMGCPKCKKKSFTEHPILRKPDMGIPFEWECSCTHCGHNWEEMVLLDVTLSPLVEVKKKTKKAKPELKL